jgi:hypothetical protein
MYEWKPEYIEEGIKNAEDYLERLWNQNRTSYLSKKYFYLWKGKFIG